MRTLPEYLAEAMEEYASHAYDQWDFAWSAQAVAKDAAARGEVSRGNVAFLASRIVAAYEAAEKVRLAELAARDEAERPTREARQAAELAKVSAAWLAACAVADQARCRSQIIALARSVDGASGEWSRADLSGTNWQRLSSDAHYAHLLAAYLGGRHADIYHGHGDCEGMTYDLGDIHTGSWSVRPDVDTLIKAGDLAGATALAQQIIAPLVAIQRGESDWQEQLRLDRIRWRDAEAEEWAARLAAVRAEREAVRACHRSARFAPSPVAASPAAQILPTDWSALDAISRG